jgi:hypothetical protein
MLRGLRFANSRDAPKVPHGTSGTNKLIRHTLLEASGALTDWTQRAGSGCPRSLAQPAAR